MTAPTPLHVVAGVIRDVQGRVLLAQRPPGKHLAGLWEFPGGKVDPGETATHALHRELDEELGIRVAALRPLIRIPWQYPDQPIVLDVFEVLEYVGEPHAREGQQLAWYALERLSHAAMPPADYPVVAALRLPLEYLISGEPDDADVFLASLDTALASGARLLQLRVKRSPRFELSDLVTRAQRVCRASNAILVLNIGLDLAQRFAPDGVQLSAAELASCTVRPLPRDRWVGASCHDAAELAQAAAIGVDFVTLSPVLATSSHVDAPTLGWDRLAALCLRASVPVYALGGMRPRDLAYARELGAHGIAGISAFWPVAAIR